MCHDGDKNICCGDERNEDDATENVYEKLSDTLAEIILERMSNNVIELPLISYLTS